MRVVCDCMVYAQALIHHRCNSALCLRLAQEAHFELVVSDFVLDEIRALPSKLSLR